MTDYKAWEKYDPEKDTLRIEQDWQIEEVSDDIIHTEKRIIQTLEEIIVKLRKISTALRSKAAVEVLKSKSGRNRRRKDPIPVVEGESPGTNLTPPPVPPPPILQIAEAMENFTQIIELVITENIKTVKLLDSHNSLLASESCYTIMMKLPYLEDAFNSVLVAIEKIFEVDPQRINHEELEGQTFLLIADTREKVHSIMANTTATLALCALSMGDYAAAADFSRCHLKLFGKTSKPDEEKSESALNPNLMTQVKKKDNKSSGNSSIVAMWVIRGRAMIGLGCPYLASLHFNQVRSLRSSFPKIDIILTALQDAQILTAQHTSSIGLMSLQDLIEYEVHHLFISPSITATKQKHRKQMLSSDAILNDITRCLITPLTISLSLHSPLCTPCSTSVTQYQIKQSTMQSRSCHSQFCSSDSHSNIFPSLHMPDDSSASISSASPPTSTSTSDSNQSSNRKLKVLKNSFPQNLFSFISSEIQQIRLSSSPSSSSSFAMRQLVVCTDPLAISSTSEQESACLYLLFIRRAFYSAQIFYLENLYRSAELHYWTSIVVILTCLNFLNTHETLSEMRFPQFNPTSSSSSSSSSSSPSPLPTLKEYLLFYYSTALLNIASCQIHQPQRKKPSSIIHSSQILSNTHNSSPIFSSIQLLLTKSSPELCDLVIALFPQDPIPFLRKAQIMTKLKCHDEAIELLQNTTNLLLQSSSPSLLLSSHFIIDHGERVIFSQYFIGKINEPLPFMNSSNLMSAIYSLTNYITHLMNKNVQLSKKDK